MKTSSERLLTISERLYRLLLFTYPTEFRRAYRHEMMQTFRDCCRESWQRRGQWGILRLWGLILSDLVTTAFTEHARIWIALLKRLFFNATDTLLTTEGNIAMATQFHLNVAQHSDIGRERKVNEDSMVSIVPEDPQVMAKKGALFVVADGMGGYTMGDVASEMAVNVVRDAYYADENDDVNTSLLQAMQQANAIIYQASQSQEPLPEKDKIMGTTCVAAVLRGDTVYVANVGDSRAYIVRGDQVIQISQDHSLVAEQVRAGLLTPEQAREHPERNKIYRCFGDKADVEVDLFAEPVQEGDLLVLCTDGLSGLVDDEELRDIVQQLGPQESAYHLVERANEHGGPDNITAIVVRISLEESKEPQAV
jgi:serine/threonine protein phosphatase PrpC